jgi:hypothetical protein
MTDEAIKHSEFGLVYQLRFEGGALNETAADRIEFLNEWVEAHTRKIDRYWKALKLIADQGGQTESRIARAALGDTQ